MFVTTATSQKLRNECRTIVVLRDEDIVDYLRKPNYDLLRQIVHVRRVVQQANVQEVLAHFTYGRAD